MQIRYLLQGISDTSYKYKSFALYVKIKSMTIFKKGSFGKF